MKTIFKTLLLIGMVLLVTSGLAQAQNTKAPFCGDLSADDCAIITTSEETMKALDSRSFNLDLSLNISGVPKMSEPMTFKLNGSGSLAVDHKAVPDTSKIDPTTLSKDPKAIFDLVAKALPAISGDWQFTLEIPDAVIKQAKNADVPKTVTLHMKLVDGVGYVDVSELAKTLPQLKGAQGWMGVNLPDLVNQILKQPGFGAAMNMNGGMNMGMSAEMSSAFSDPANLAQFVTIERLADGEVDSHKVAVFKTTLDYAAMFSMPEMQDMIQQQMQANGNKMTAKQTEAVMLMLRGLAQGMEFSVTQNIGLDDHYLYQSSINMKFDMSSMKEQIGGPLVITMSATFSQSDFNSVPAITAPEGALVIPVESIIPSKK